MKAAFFRALFRCFARVLHVAAGSLIWMLPSTGRASYASGSDTDSAYLPTKGAGTQRLAILPSDNPHGPIGDVPARPP